MKNKILYLRESTLLQHINRLNILRDELTNLPLKNETTEEFGEKIYAINSEQLKNFCDKLGAKGKEFWNDLKYGDKCSSK